MKRFVVLVASFIFAGSSASADCIHGCSSVNVNVLEYVKITQPSEGSCNPDCSGSGGTQNKIEVLDGNCSGSVIRDGIFCTSEAITVDKIYQVNAISSGCTGTPQGCVRICGPCN